MTVLPPLPADMPEALRMRVEEMDRCQRSLDAAWPKVMELRRRYFVEHTDTAKAEMEAAIEVAQAARAEGSGRIQ